MKIERSVTNGGKALFTFFGLLIACGKSRADGIFGMLTAGSVSGLGSPARNGVGRGPVDIGVVEVVRMHSLPLNTLHLLPTVVADHNIDMCS